jgi:hypothetical protein
MGLRCCREGEDHRSVLELLRELRARAEGGEGVVGAPGATSTRPLHIAMQVGGPMLLSHGPSYTPVDT